MKIIYMLHDGLNYNGGPAINANRLLPGLSQRGHEVIAIALYHDFPSNAEYLRDQGIDTITKQYPQYSEDLVQWILQIVKEKDPDIFIPNIVPQGGVAARWVKEAGIPTVIAHRADNDYNWILAKTFAVGSKKWQTSGVVCVSNYLRSELEKQIKYPIATEVIPSGVPLSQHISKQEGNILKVVFAGRLEQRQKRVWEVLEAFISASKHLEQIEFTFIGSGNEQEGLENAVKEQNLQNEISFTGRLQGEEYHAKLAENHVIVLMSDYEGIPGSLMDGMVCGLIPICLKMTSIDELVQDGKTGLLINDRKTSFLETLRRIKNNFQLRKEISKNARAHIEAHYSLKHTISTWENLCKTLVAQSKRHREIEVPNTIEMPYQTISIENMARRHIPVRYRLEQGLKRLKRVPPKIIDKIS